MSSPSVSSTPKWDASVWGLLAVLCGVLFLDGLDVSMVGMALPSIESDLGLTTSQLQWVVSGYVLGYGGFLLLGGRAADLLGRRRMFLISLGVFVVASGLAAVANDGTLLIALRFIKGVSAGFTAPAGAAPPPRSSSRFDLAGAVSLTVGMLLLVYSVVEAPEHGWASARTLGS